MDKKGVDLDSILEGLRALRENDVVEAGAFSKSAVLHNLGSTDLSTPLY